MRMNIMWFGATILFSTALIAAGPTAPTAPTAPVVPSIPIPPPKVPPAVAAAMPKELKLSNEAKLEGGVEANAATAEDLALPRDKFPGVHFAAAKDFLAQNPDRSKTPSGLYILDADFIPAQLPAILKAQKLTLQQDGTLTDAKKQKTTLLLFPRLIKVNGKQGALPNEGTKWSLIPSAHAATPYPLSWVSAAAWWSTPSGFCRTVTADSQIDAWGPLLAGARPHTRIEYLEARVRLNHNPDRRCPGADSCHAHDDWFVGCFWPAYSASGSHYVNAKEGAFMWSWSYSW